MLQRASRQSMRQMTNPQAISRYDSVAMSLHWLIALGVIGNFALGLYHGELPDDDPMARTTIFFHMSLGLLVLVLSVVRVGWRLTHKIPALPIDMPEFQKVLARTVEGLLYILIIAIPVAGWMLVSATTNPHPIPFFGLFDWPHISALAPMAQQYGRPFHRAIGETHELLAWTAIVLAGLHFAAAIYHHRIRRDDVVKSMLPFG